MRVGIDARSASGGKGGIAVYVRALARALAEAYPEDEWRLYAHRARRGRRARAEGLLGGGNVRLHARPVPSLAAVALSRAGLGPDALVGGCDVFHLTDYAWLGRTRAPLVATVHDVLFEELPRCYTPEMRRGLRHVTRLLVRHAARIVVPSPRTKAGLVERFGMDPDRVDVTPLAPRTLPDVVPARGARPYLLAVGTVEPRKNLARTVEAHRRAVARGLCADLVVVGARGWLFDDVDRAAGRNPLARFEGEVDDARLSALYRGAAALVYPSLGEGYGLPVAEAMSLGVPVVTSAGTACQDLGGDAVLAVDPYDVEALSDAVERVATDAALARRLAALGRAQASAWSWAGTAAATRASYARAAG